MSKFPMLRWLPACAVLVAAAPLAGCHTNPPPKPLSQLSEKEQLGHTVFGNRCAACHYDRMSGPLHGPSMLGVFNKPYLPSGAPANDERVTATVLHGRNLMPAQPTMDPEDMANLLAYLHYAMSHARPKYNPKTMNRASIARAPCLKGDSCWRGEGHAAGHCSALASICWS